ncbi:phospholipase D-like domain-containing protein [Sphingomonas sp. PAMC 26617]|uniref:phospholipase D-like domain-containing protein n=1 Tax=Sphingomonas sp. PAMC 26617 TaxID=1112216 RepID=UPI0012F4AF89|nr:nuclease [Sphingomonas sp. PAMC 26617]
MQAVAFSNNDIAVVAWTFGGRIPGCLGFGIYRTDVKAGVETCLPALATFPGQQATPNRTTADDPVQKFFWKDVYAKRRGSYRYRIVPLGGTPGNLSPLAIGALTTNIVQLTPDHGVLSVYFNRGILATQATAHALDDAHGNLEAMKNEALKRIADPTDPLRLNLAGDMVAALTALPTEAASQGGELFCALYEFEDQELIGALEQVGKQAHVILSNMPGTVDGTKTDDTYKAERDAAAPIIDVIDRMMPGGHIGHNKFTILAKDGTPQAVQFGSTNWTGRALCAQSNNTIIARSPAIADAFKTYWDDLKSDTDASDGKGKQLAPLRQADQAGVPNIQLEDGSAAVDLWFSPNTNKARQPASRRPSPEPTPSDLAELFDLIKGAKQAILFVEFEPGKPSVIDAIAAAQKANPALFVRGTVTVASAAEQFAVGIKGDAPGDGGADDQNIPEDYRVIPAGGVGDQVGVWERELNSAGFAVTHSKYVVIDPFTDGCVVAMGSHNQGYQASYNNDENLVIIKGHRPIAEAYAANALDIYDHYAWRWWLTKNPSDAWTSLKPDDSWQNSYFDAANRPTSAELSFWLAASPSASALPSPALGDANRAVADMTLGQTRDGVVVPPKRPKRVSHATGHPVGHVSDDADHG